MDPPRDEIRDPPTDQQTISHPAIEYPPRLEDRDAGNDTPATFKSGENSPQISALGMTTPHRIKQLHQPHDGISALSNTTSYRKPYQHTIKSKSGYLDKGYKKRLSSPLNERVRPDTSPLRSQISQLPPPYPSSIVSVTSQKGTPLYGPQPPSVYLTPMTPIRTQSDNMSTDAPSRGSNDLTRHRSMLAHDDFTFPFHSKSAGNAAPTLTAKGPPGECTPISITPNEMRKKPREIRIFPPSPQLSATMTPSTHRALPSPLLFGRQISLSQQSSDTETRQPAKPHASSSQTPQSSHLLFPVKLPPVRSRSYQTLTPQSTRNRQGSLLSEKAYAEKNILDEFNFKFRSASQSNQDDANADEMVMSIDGEGQTLSHMDRSDKHGDRPVACDERPTMEDNPAENNPQSAQSTSQYAFSQQIRSSYRSKKAITAEFIDTVAMSAMCSKTEDLLTSTLGSSHAHVLLRRQYPQDDSALDYISTARKRKLSQIPWLASSPPHLQPSETTQQHASARSEVSVQGSSIQIRQTASEAIYRDQMAGLVYAVSAALLASHQPDEAPARESSLMTTRTSPPLFQQNHQQLSALLSPPPRSIDNALLTQQRHRTSVIAQATPTPIVSRDVFVRASQLFQTPQRESMMQSPPSMVLSAPSSAARANQRNISIVTDVQMMSNLVPRTTPPSHNIINNPHASSSSSSLLRQMSSQPRRAVIYEDSSESSSHSSNDTGLPVGVQQPNQSARMPSGQGDRDDRFEEQSETTSIEQLNSFIQPSSQVPTFQPPANRSVFRIYQRPVQDPIPLSSPFQSQDQQSQTGVDGNRTTSTTHGAMPSFQSTTSAQREGVAHTVGRNNGHTQPHLTSMRSSSSLPQSNHGQPSLSLIPTGESDLPHNYRNLRRSNNYYANVLMASSPSPILHSIHVPTFSSSPLVQPKHNGPPPTQHEFRASPSFSRETARQFPLTDPIIFNAPYLVDDFYVSVLDWSKSNTLLLGGGQDLHLWNMNTTAHTSFSILPEISQYLSQQHSAMPRIQSVCSMDGNMVALGTDQGLVYLFDIETSQLVTTLVGHIGRIGALSYCGAQYTNDFNMITNSYQQSLSLLASGGRDRTINIYDYRAGTQPLFRLIGHQQEVCGLRWSFDGLRLASGSNDNSMRIWSVYGDTKIYQHHRAAVRALAWSPFHPTVIATGGGTACRRICMFLPVSMDYLHASHPSISHLFPDFISQRFVDRLTNSSSSFIMHDIGLWDTQFEHISDPNRMQSPQRNSGPPFNAPLHASSSRALTKSIDSGNQVCCLVWSKIANELISTQGFSQNQVGIWSIPQLEQLGTMRGHQSRPLFLAMSPDGSTVATGSGDKTIRLWKLYSHREVQRFARGAQSIR